MKKLLLSISAGFLPASLSAQLVINEILFDPAFDNGDPTVGDANGDGTRDAAEDEFVELVNIGGSSLDLTGWTVSDGLGVKHTFAGGTLADGQSVVVFGGGVPTGTFGGSLVVVADSGTLGLSNGGDSVIVSDPGGVEIDSYSYAGGEVNDESLVLSIELDETSGYVGHSSAVGSGGSTYSPGTQNSGAPFGGDALSIMISPSSFSENAGAAAATGTVTRTGDNSSALVVTLSSDDTSEAIVPGTVTIPAGMNSVGFDVDAVDDTAQDADQTVTISATGTGVFSGSFTLTVEDDEAPIPTFTLMADPSSISENGGASTVTLEVSVGSPSGYVFDLSSSDASELAVPATVTVAANATTASFVASGVDDATSDGAQNVTITATDPNGVISMVTVAITVSDDEGFQVPNIVINEVRIDDPSFDDDEYVEIYSPDAGTVSLDRVSIVVIGDSGAGSGVVERVVDLTGESLSGNYFLVGSDTMTLATPDLTTFQNWLENGDNISIFLAVDFTGSEGDDLDAEDDGVMETKPWAEIIDGVSLVEEANGDDGAGGFFQPGGTEWDYSVELGLPSIGPDGLFVPGHVFRSPNGTGTWQIGAFADDPGDPLADPPIPAVTVMDTPKAENGTTVVAPGDDVEIVDFSVQPGGATAVIVATGLGNKLWKIQTSNDLGDTDPWADLSVGVSESDNADGSTNFSFSTTAGDPKQFYRLTEQ